jgi:spore maturation protein CgeB
MVSDKWKGLDAFFAPGEEIFAVQKADDVIAVLDLSDAEIHRVGAAARERTLAEHTSDRRALQLIAALERANAKQPEGVPESIGV